MSIIYYWLLFNLVFVVALYIGKKRMDHLRKLRDSKEAMHKPVVISSRTHPKQHTFADAETIFESKKA